MSRRRLRRCVVRRARLRISRRSVAAWRQRDLDREDRPLSLQRAHPNRMAEKFAQALDDREAQAQTLAPLAGGVVHLMVFFEDRLQFRLRDADPGVPDLDAQFALASAAPDEHPAALGIFQRVRDQIADHLLEQTPIAPNGEAARDHAQREAGRLRVISQFFPQTVEQLIHREVDDFGLTAPTSIWLMSSSVFSMPVMAPKASSMPLDQLLSLLPRRPSSPAGPGEGREFAMAAGGRGSPQRESASWRCSPIPPDAWRR